LFLQYSTVRSCCDLRKSGTTTNSTGNYVFYSVPVGNYMVNFSLGAFTPNSKSGNHHERRIGTILYLSEPDSGPPFGSRNKRSHGKSNHRSPDINERLVTYTTAQQEVTPGCLSGWHLCGHGGQSGFDITGTARWSLPREIPLYRISPYSKP